MAGPSLWNNLPVTIREAGTLTTFKSTLKTHLFRIAFKTLLRWTDIFVKLTFKCNLNDCSIIIQLIVLYSLYNFNLVNVLS